jgi:pimeloyl-ACP methyl ester carboxylesterase
MRKLTCEFVEFDTPRGFNLTGFLIGPTKPQKVIILVHGFCGSALNTFARNIGFELINSKTAIFTFNNRGHDIVSKLYQNARNKKGYKKYVAGGAHEIFTDCTDDIEGAIKLIATIGVKEIYLAGHSTGCQKSVYWASKIQGGRRVRGIILFAPISDYSLAVKNRIALSKTTRIAKQLIKSGRKHALLPESLWPGHYDAQRFLSLNSPDSSEQIFPYEQRGKKPKALLSVKVPILVLLAQKDEYGDRPADHIAQWFAKHTKPSDAIYVVPKVTHNFIGANEPIKKHVRQFMQG